MAEQLAVIVVGDEAETCALMLRQAFPWWISITTVPAAALCDLDDRCVRQAFDQANAPLLALIDARVASHDPGVLSVLGHLDPGASCQVVGAASVAPLATGPLVRRATQSPCLRYPVRWATLMASPEPFVAIAFERSVYARVGALRDCDHPLWDWLVRAAACGVDVKCQVRESLSTEGDERLPSLAAIKPPASRGWLFEHLAEVSSPEPKGDPALIAQRALKAGLFLWHDDLDESHRLAQSIERKGRVRLGDYWHAILHRREPDYSNAKYWFRQIGVQPTFDELAAAAGQILGRCRDPEAAAWSNRLQSGGRWNPLTFVDLCEAVAGGQSADLQRAARRIQQVEMALLFDSTFEATQ